jgi:mRNA interferase YafQ
MRGLLQTNRFKRDWKRMKKRGAASSKLSEVLELLAADQPLPERCRPHKLVGEWMGFWECHIEPDWLLVYDLEDPNVLTLVATGTHADLFR